MAVAVELLETADVGHRLAPLAALQAALEGLGLAAAETRLRVGRQRAAVHAQDVAEQHLGVQACRLGAGFAETRGGRGQRLADRW